MEVQEETVHYLASGHRKSFIKKGSLWVFLYGKGGKAFNLGRTQMGLCICGGGT